MFFCVCYKTGVSPPSLRTTVTYLFPPYQQLSDKSDPTGNNRLVFRSLKENLIWPCSVFTPLSSEMTYV